MPCTCLVRSWDLGRWIRAGLALRPSTDLGGGLGGVRGPRGDPFLDERVPVFDGSEELVGLFLAVVDRGDHADVLGHLEDLVLVRLRLRVNTVGWRWTVRRS